MRNMFVSSVALIGAIVAAAPAAAAVTVYTSEATFKAALSSTTNYSFNFNNSYAQIASYTGGSVTFTSPQLYPLAYYGPTPFLGDFDPTLSISSTVSAAGFYLGAPDGAKVNYSFGGVTGTVSLPSNGNYTFLGFINSSGSINGSFTNNPYEMDVFKFITGTVAGASAGAVPEPATWAMMVAGFGMVGAGLRHRRGQTVRDRIVA